MRPVLVALAALVVCACSPAEEPAPPAAPPEPAPVLGGVDLTRPVRALGTEPFWSVELTGTEIVYKGADTPEQRAPGSAPLVQGTTATYTGETADGTTFNVTLIATECSDGMSDRTYPLTAMVQIDTQELAGCAAGSAAVMAGGESGPVV